MDTYIKNMMPSERIKTGGSIIVSSGGTAAHMCITSGGIMEVLEGGCITNVTNSGGSLVLSNKGRGNVVNGFTVESITIKGDEQDYTDTGILSTYNGIVKSAELTSNGNLFILGSSVASDTVINGGHLQVF